MDSFRIVVVDDSALFRTMLRNVLSEIPGCEVVASVADGKAAIEKVVELKPDLVTLDVEMPEMNGIDALRELKRRMPGVNVVMVSRLTSTGAKVTTDALIEGAFDFILKPSSGSVSDNKATLRTALEERIRALTEDSTDSSRDSMSTLQMPSHTHPSTRCEAVVIGSSTGGPDALARVIPDLPANLRVPVFVVQHMPERFTATLASRLNEASNLEVLEAVDGMRVRSGQVVLAKGGNHLQLERQLSAGVLIRLTDAPPENSCRPAVDYTLRSAADLYGQHLLVVILTGMGKDGTAGCQIVKARGGNVVAQHSDGCTVYGMPKAVINAGLADDIVKLPRIAAEIVRLTKICK